MRPQEWNKILAGLVLMPPVAYTAHAETYLTEEKAAAILFPGIKLKPTWMELTSEESKKIEKISGEKVRTRKVRIWWGRKKEALIIDEVYGKHEFITYAVAVTKEGKVKDIEILDYRETYGYEIRNAQWRRHFVGKTRHDPLELDKDIPNISGATLSSAHVIGGVRRVLHTYAILKQKA